MLLRHVALVAAVLLLSAPPALAQDDDDDLLAPLTTTEEAGSPDKAKKSKKAKRRPPKKPSKTRGKPAPVAESAPEGDEDLLAPLVKTGVRVQLGTLRGARLFVDGKDMGPVLGGIVEVEPGEHTLLVRRPGYREFSRNITLNMGEVQDVNAVLEAVSGIVTVKVDVPGAVIFINGEDKGPAPLEGVLLPPGSHDIEARLKGFRTETSRISVRAGKDYAVNLNLRPETETGTASGVAQADSPRSPVLTPSQGPETSPAFTPRPEVVASSEPTVFQRWYFWAGVGAVATAAVVGTVVATQPPAGLSPEQVCGGPCDAIINPPSGAGAIRF
jgi:copper chaperone CopZ